MTRILRFANDELHAAKDPIEPGTSPEVADSMLMLRGAVRNLDMHRERFASQLAEVAPELVDQLPRFYELAATELANENEVFPRIDYYDGSLWLRVRPAPQLFETTELISHHFEVTKAPIKGPNIALYTSLNEQNACDTLRLDSNSNVIETATSAVVWWMRDEGKSETLHIVAIEDRIPSTTERFVIRHAQENGFKIVESTAPVVDLLGSEVWTVNALHGIRLVTSIDHHEQSAPNALRLALFRKALDSSWQAF